MDKKPKQKIKRGHVFLLRNPKRQSGFTLIELMVVISIISFLASIVLTSSIDARENAQDNVLIQNLTTFSGALELYYQDNGFYPYLNMMDQNPCIQWGFNAPGIHCILGKTTASSGYYSATNDNAISASLKPYMTTLPAELVGTNGTASLFITDPTFNTPNQVIQDLQSNTCYILIPNGYFLWGELNNRQTQLNINGVNSHGYFIQSNMQPTPCS